MIKQYKKWAEDLDLDYDKHFGKVDDPDFLVQLSRDSLQEELENNISSFTEAELNEIKKIDKFILDNLSNSSRWLSPDHTKPRAFWWNYLDMIKSGEMEKPDIEKIFEDHIAQLN